MLADLISKAKKFGTLLAASSLAEEYKKALLDNLEFMPERSLDALIKALEEEVTGLEILTEEAESFLKTENKENESNEKQEEDTSDSLGSF